jgi:peptide/nickel transport system substrate-binding protein
VPPPQGDTTQAKSFAAAYKTDTGQDMSFTYVAGTDALSLQAAQLIQSYMKNAGIKMNIKQEEQSQAINDVIAKNYQASGWRNHPGFDPDDQWVWWHCYSAPAATTPATDKNIAAPGPPDNGNNCDNIVNFSGFNDKIINTALETGRENPDPSVRKTAYQNLNKEFAKQFWEAWGYLSIWTIPYQTNIHNVLGVNLPTATSPDATGAKPFPGLSSWVDISGLWRSNG